MASKYVEVYSDLAARIRSGVYPADSRLPAENILIEQYGVSRDTLRKALSQLEQEGFIQKSRGKEALVLNHEKVVFPVSGLTSFQELAQAEGYRTVTHVARLETVRGNRELIAPFTFGEPVGYTTPTAEIQTDGSITTLAYTFSDGRKARLSFTLPGWLTVDPEVLLSEDILPVLYLEDINGGSMGFVRLR